MTLEDKQFVFWCHELANILTNKQVMNVICCSHRVRMVVYYFKIHSIKLVIVCWEKKETEKQQLAALLGWFARYSLEGVWATNANAWRGLEPSTASAGCQNEC